MATLSNVYDDSRTDDEIVTRLLAAAGIEVEKTAEERIGAFVEEVRREMLRGWPLSDAVTRHFPEVTNA